MAWEIYPFTEVYSNNLFSVAQKMLNENCFREGTAHVTLEMHMDYTSSSQFLFQRDQKHQKIGGKKKVFTEKVNFQFVLGLTIILNI